MDLKKIESILQAEAELKVCPICGTPYKPYHSRQKTCGNSECIRINRSEITKRRNAERKEENPDEYRANRRALVQRYRRKKRAMANREAQLKELSKEWEKQTEFDRKVTEYGIDYGKRSAEKVLADVPKIDVNMERREDNEQNVL